MIGLFDSGSGGLNTVRYIKKAAPDIDLVYLIDREHAPYGIKSEKELIRITEENIEKLIAMRADRVLIACCTASTVHPRLKDEYKKISVPIISAVANMAKKSTRSRGIGVIATKHTAESHAFGNLLDGYFVKEAVAQELVGMIDGGLSDSNMSEEDEKKIEDILSPVLLSGIDTLILGCTHFPSIVKTAERISARYGIKNVIDSARAGGDLIIKLERQTKRSK